MNSLLAKRQAFNDSFQSRFNVYLIAKKKLHYYPSSIITHKNLSTTPFITCNTCYSFSCLRMALNVHTHLFNGARGLSLVWSLFHTLCIPGATALVRPRLLMFLGILYIASSMGPEQTAFLGV